MASKLKITWVKSAIGAKKQHQRTIRALGLHRLNQSVVKDASDPVRGMVFAVNHLVRVEEVD
ncbi:MAG TPA: 50S ribosomal protein L30 [Candidatus Sumerlaeota bacterium]|nr:50S ribosomal protein L30 [Candidatus Sumerlaeota bacterium]HPK02561.1 50S ribosomal protein L30 [Candidatus Sumerlaeota bacterium]